MTIQAETVQQQAYSLVQQALRAPGLSSIDLAKLRLAAFCLGVSLHEIPPFPVPEDARKRIDELYLIARHVDALIEAIGEDAQSNFGGIDMSLFRGQLSNALDGNATYDLESAAERINEEHASYADEAFG